MRENHADAIDLVQGDGMEGTHSQTEEERAVCALSLQMAAGALTAARAVERLQVVLQDIT